MKGTFQWQAKWLQAKSTHPAPQPGRSTAREGKGVLMRYFVMLSLFVLLAIAFAVAAPPRRRVFEEQMINAYEQQVTDVSSVVHPTVPDDVNSCWVQALTQNVRYYGSFHAGTLTTRTDANTGVCTLPAQRSLAHGITDSHTVTVWWDGGRRTAMTVSSVDGTAVTVDGGSGDDFPVLSTAVELGKDPTASTGTQIEAGYSVAYPFNPNRLRLIEESASAELNFVFIVAP